MRIVVLVKQVPQVAALRFDPERRRPVRAGVPLVLNAFDRRALGAALRLRQEHGGQVIALSMGSPQARAALEECLALGADRAIHLSDPALAGGDVLATARALAAAIRPLAADLVLCGQRSVDAETSQLGPALAELLDLPRATAVTRLDLTHGGRRVQAERLTDLGRDLLDMPLPCLVTAAERLHRPEAGDPPPLPGRSAVEARTLADLGLEPDRVGQAGSATRVLAIRPVERPRRREVLDGATDAALARLLDLLDRARVENDADGGADGVATMGAPRRADAAVLVFVERLADGSVHPAALDLIRRSAGVADRVLALLAGSDDLERAVPPGRAERSLPDRQAPGGDGQVVPLLRRAGADTVLVARHPALACFAAEPYVWLLERALVAHRPSAVLVPATTIGRELAPALAARLGLGLVSECEEIVVDPAGQLRFVRPALGGAVLADVETLTRPALATVRPRAYRQVHADRPIQGGKARGPAAGGGADQGPGEGYGVSALDVHGLPAARAIVLERHDDTNGAGLALDDAELVIGVGVGIGGPDGLAEIRRLVAGLGAAVGGTRKAVDRGLLPPQQQIGLSGRQIAPRVYLAVGARGSFNHAIGIRRAETIAAINADRRAEIFDACDLGIVADWRAIVPALTQAIHRRRSAVGSARLR